MTRRAIAYLRLVVTVASLSEVSDATRNSIGRYFTLVSAVPSSLLVSYVFVLATSGAWTGAPKPSRVTAAISHLGIGSVLALAGASVALGLALHPLQFALIQMLEGYWGTSRFALRLRAVRMWHHWQRIESLGTERSEAEKRLGQRPDDDDQDPDGLGRMYLLAKKDESDRLTTGQPQLFNQVMPTRLGNILRFQELTIGAPYGLNALQIMPYIAHVVSSADMDYVNDQRSQLDLAVRMTITGFLGSMLTLLFCWRDGLWLLTALGPYLVAYLSYRGAIVAARSYCNAVAVVITLNRFELYKRLHLPPPADTAAERRVNQRLGDLLEGDDQVSVRYRHPAP